MTAKSRRHKLDKRRKSDEHPQPRRSEEAGRRKEGARGRAGLTASISQVDETAAFDGRSFVKAIRQAKLHSVGIVPEGQGFPGSFIEVSEIPEIDWKVGVDTDDYDIRPLNEIKPWDYGFYGVPEHFRFYLNDTEKELLDELWENFKRRHPGYEEALRPSGASDAASSS